jgi:hypothetical protein
MKIRLNRTSNDHLVNDGERTVEEFEVTPDLLCHEMVGWEWQESKWDAATQTLTIYVWDTAEPEAYLEQA